VQIIKLLATSLLVFSLNVSANQFNPFDSTYDNVETHNTTVETVSTRLTAKSATNAASVSTPTSDSLAVPPTVPAPDYGADLAAIADNSMDDSNSVSEDADSENNSHRIARSHAISRHASSSDVNTPARVNPKIAGFIKRLFNNRSLYVKWLTAFTASIQNDDDFSAMDIFFSNNGCDACTYQEVMDAIEIKKSEHLVFWTGDYQTNLTSIDGTGRKLGLTLKKLITVQSNSVMGASFKIDGKAIFGATFKDHTLTWDYGTNMQPNLSRGSIIFSEVFLNGQYAGHQFAGKLVWQSDLEGGVQSFTGFTRLVHFQKNFTENSTGDNVTLGDNTSGPSGPSESSEVDTGYGSSASSGIGSGVPGVTITVLDRESSWEGGTAKFSIVLDAEPIFPARHWADESIVDLVEDLADAAPQTVSVEYTTSNPSEGRFSNNINGVTGSDVSFNKYNWNVPVEVLVYGQNDGLDNGDTPYQITFQILGRGTTNYTKRMWLDPIHLINRGRNINDSVDPVTEKPQMRVGFVNYPAKNFGTQIWTTENMRHYPSKVGEGFWTGFDGNDNEFKFYDWNAAMNGETKEGSQGICAPGWHIPTDGDWKVLEAFLGMQTNMLDADNAYRGTDQGTQLLAGGASEFNAQLVGHYANAAIKDKGVGVRFMTSTSINDDTISEDDAKFVSRYLGKHNPNLVRYILLKQSSKSLEAWSFAEIEAWVGDTNVARGAVVNLVGSGIYALASRAWPWPDEDVSDDINEAVTRHVHSTYTPGAYEIDDYVFGMAADYISTVGNSSVTNGSQNTGLGYGRTDSDVKNLNGNGLTIRPNGYLKVDLGKAYPIDTIRLKEFNKFTTSMNAPFSFMQRFAGHKLVIFTTQYDLDGTQTATELSLNSSNAMRVGRIKDGANSTQAMHMPLPDVTTRFKQNAATTIWRGAVRKGGLGGVVRCLKDSSNSSGVSIYVPRQITLAAGKPMTPIAFGNTATSTTKNWSILPTPNNGLSFDNATGVMSGTPLVAHTIVNYEITTAESKATSHLSVVVVDSLDTPVLISSIQIAGHNLLKTGENTQLQTLITPSNASNKKLVWSIVGDQSIASIDQTGKLTALKSGKIKVIATATDLGATHGTLAIQVTAINNLSNTDTADSNQPPFISADVNNLMATVGTAITPIAWVNIGSVATQWRVAPPLPMGLSMDAKTGVISGVPSTEQSAVHYRITAKNNFGMDTAWLRITVQPVPKAIAIAGIQIRTPFHRAVVGSVVQLDAIISPSNATNDITWLSLNSNLASVNDKGRVVMKHQTGLVTIVARSNKNPTISSSAKILIVDHIVNGKAYNTIVSPKTGKAWLDRNLGANRACKTQTDIQCYGNLYQFGRIDDGHQTRQPHAYSNQQISNLTPSQNTYFMTGKDWTSADVSGAVRSAIWSSKNNICPIGFVVPTLSELMAEDIGTGKTAFKNFLQLPKSGRRSRTSDRELIDVGSTGYYWSRTVDSDFKAKVLTIKSNGKATTQGLYRNNGLSVRCIQDANYKKKRSSNTPPMKIAGIDYQTMRIGHQVWTAENMRHGVNNPNKGIYSYNNDTNNDTIYGKYYTLSASTASLGEDGQGICAQGWRIPTDNDWTVLEKYLGTSQPDLQVVERTLANEMMMGNTDYMWRGTQAHALQKRGYSGFNAVMSGRIEINDFVGRSILKDTTTYFFTPQHINPKNPTNQVLFRALKPSVSGIYKGFVSRNEKIKDEKYAFNVRCIQKSPPPMSVQGIDYKTIKIGQQTWTAENMRHSATTGNNNQLYSWESAMNGDTKAGAQGICATGWHIPTEHDWRVLERYLGMSLIKRKQYSAWRVDNHRAATHSFKSQQGDALKQFGYTGFEAVMSGRFDQYGSTPVAQLGNTTSFWTSSRPSIANTYSLVWFRSLNRAFSGIYKGVVNESRYKLSVRCIKD